MLGNNLFVLDSGDRNTTAVRAIDLETGTTHVVAANGRADVSGLLLHPTKKQVEAVTFDTGRRKWKTLVATIDEDLSYLHEVAEGQVEVLSRSLDDSLWTVAYISDHGPTQYYLYNREPRAIRRLFDSHPQWADLPLVPMQSLTIRARDDRPLVSYLSLPLDSDTDRDGRPDRPLPLVLYVHGGPSARDVWGVHPVHQFLANRGYAVLSVNYRGSTGFGKEFLTAADGEWGGKMQDDLIDAVRFAVTEGIADEQRVGIMGGDYGGYASLMGVALAPETFACGVDIVGPTQLVTLLENPPPSWSELRRPLSRLVGDITSAAGRERLLARSPISYADRISRPLLIGQGARDAQTRRGDTEQIVASLQRRGVPVTYLVYPDEGHGFANRENRLSFYAATEGFLAEQLGGRCQPIDDALRASSVQVQAGLLRGRGVELNAWAAGRGQVSFRRIQLPQQFGDGRRRIGRVTHRRLDRHSSAADPHQPRKVFRRDAADREGRQSDLGVHRPDQLDPGQPVKRLGGGRERGTDADVVGAVEDGLPSLREVVCRDAHEGRFPYDLPDGMHRQLVLSHMDAIRVGRRGHIGPIIHDEQRVVTGRDVTGDTGSAQQVAVTQMLVSQLEQVDAGSHQSFYPFREREGIGPPVHEHVEAGDTQPLPARCGNVNGPLQCVKPVA